jgi:hypothetical protein
MNRTKTILCELEFYDQQVQQPQKIIGYVSLKNLFSKESKWLAVNSRLRKEGIWKENEVIVHKGDINKITFYEPHSYFAFDKKTFNLNNSLMPFFS